MVFYIDSQEIINSTKRYQDRISGFDPCITPFEESLSLKEGEHLSEYFFGHTNDKIQWKDTLRMLSESPLSVFDNYKEIYMPSKEWHPPFDMYPYFSEKNYSAKWIMLDDKLYLYDAEVFSSNEEMGGFTGDSSLKLVEKLIGKKFTKIKSFDQKVIFASWYSGTLYFKRREKRKTGEPICEYVCEPMTKITVEKGKITSMEPTFYMFQKY